MFGDISLKYFKIYIIRMMKWMLIKIIVELVFL